MRLALLIYILLQPFYETHFVYLYLVHSLELSYFLDYSGPQLCYHMYTFLFSYLPFITCIQYSHVAQFHMFTIITCIPFYL